MATYLRLIMQTAQRNPGHTYGAKLLQPIFPTKSYQLPGGPYRQMMGDFISPFQFQHRQMFNDALFHLLQPVVIAIQDFLCMGKIEIILAVFVPWQIDNRLHILRLDRNPEIADAGAPTCAPPSQTFQLQPTTIFLGSFLSNSLISNSLIFPPSSS